MKHEREIKRLIISRTDSIGDVALTLPMAGWLRKNRPDIEILFLGRTYTAPLVAACEHVHRFLNWDDVREASPDEQARWLQQAAADAVIHVHPNKHVARAARAAKIPRRIGTSHRLFHWRTCNVLLPLSRKKSALHEAQLNLQLLRPFGLRETPPRQELADYYGLSRLQPLRPDLRNLLETERFNLILHPKSRGSSKEWGEDNFARLIALLPRDRVNLVVTGTQAEGELVRSTLVEPFPFVADLTGKMTLDELIPFIANADGLLAASTGPLHIAAALGVHAIGLYPSKRPTHPGRWAPLGRHVHIIEDGRTHAYDGFLDIEPQRVADAVTSLLHSG